MATKYKIYQSEYPYHIFNRCNNKEYLFDLPRAFPVFMHYIKKYSARTEFRPHHAILMKNHFHIIGSTPKANLFEFMRLFQTKFSTGINIRKGRTNHIFGSRYGATVIDSELYLAQVIRYLYQNPVKANVLSDPEKYKYSSLQYYLTGMHEVCGLSFDPYLGAVSDHLRIGELRRLANLNLENKDYAFIKKRLNDPVLSLNS